MAEEPASPFSSSKTRLSHLSESPSSPAPVSRRSASSTASSPPSPRRSSASAAGEYYPRRRRRTRLMTCCIRFWHCIQFFNTLVVIGLVVTVVFLFIHMQYLSYEISEQDAKIQSLQEQVQQKQEGQIQQLTQAVEEEHNLTLGTLAGIFCLITCLISMFHMSSHLQNYNEPIIQRKIVAILWMSPIYSVTAFISLIFPATEEYLAMIKDFYEAYCIYTFLSFLIAVLGRGDRDKAIQVVAKHASHLESPTRLLRHFYHPPPEMSDEAKAGAVITECQILAMQFVLIRPFTSIANFIVNSLAEANNPSQYDSSTGNTGGSAASMDGLFGNGTRGLDQLYGYANNETTFDYGDGSNSTFTDSPSTPSGTETLDKSQQFQEATKTYFTSPAFAIAMVVNISICLAFMGLLKFYHAVGEDLKWCNPWPKFLTIKGVVFLTFWQGLAISIGVNLKHEESHTNVDPAARASQLQNILICLEMLVFSITHWMVFPFQEWTPNFQPQKAHKPGIGFGDFVADVNHIVKGRRRKGPRYQDTESATAVSAFSDEELVVDERFDDLDDGLFVVDDDEEDEDEDEGMFQTEDVLTPAEHDLL